MLRGVSEFDGRYAPSPSGPLHLGNLRTALLAWLFARSQGGRFLLRIEDLDPLRSRVEHETRAIAALRWLGIDWDGEPVRQSERRERHREALAQLIAAGCVYPCWCTRAEVRLASAAPHLEDGESVYPGTCRGLSGAQRADRERGGPPRAWRLDGRVQVVSFDDAINGVYSGVIDDFVLWRGDDVPAYQLAVVVDDADQGIGEVVRGDDLLASTPRQIALAQLLGLPVPHYVHVPLVLACDGKRLAKRSSAAHTNDPLGFGGSVERLVGWIGSSAGITDAGLELSAAELLGRFDVGRVRGGGPVAAPAWAGS
jgi:glutamyl-tRNA synthetase